MTGKYNIISWMSVVIVAVLVGACNFCVHCEDIDSTLTLRPIRQVTTGPPKTTLESLSLAELILVLMAKHGEAQTSAAFSSMDQQNLGQIMRILLVEVDKPLGADIVSMQEYAQNSDKQLVVMISRIVTGHEAIAKDLFTWDEKLRKFSWWKRIRSRMFLNLDKYVANFKTQGGS